MTKVKVLFAVILVNLIFIAQALAGSAFEGVYHSENNVNEKIIIYKADNDQYLIRNEAKKWKALVFKGININSKTNKPFDYYKGVIHWDKSKNGQTITNVGYIHMSLMEDGKSIIATHRWNFWKDAHDSWKETWIKE